MIVLRKLIMFQNQLKFVELEAISLGVKFGEAGLSEGSAASEAHKEAIIL